ncbi:MAG: tetratricopeptide repeat protein [Myxococcales bacterium]|nr:tetratricopeptide repeat protein [Myxococcales bacterium]
MRSRPAQLALLAATVVTSFGCTPRIRIEWSRPARFQLAPDQRIALQVEADGVGPSATNVLDAAIGFTQGQVLNKWVAVEAVRNEMDAELRRAGLNLVDRPQADLVLRARPTDWSYQLDEKKDVKSGVGRLDVRIDVLDARNPNAPPLFGSSYWAKGGAANIGEPEAMLRASKRLAGVFLSDLRPHRVSAEVELDDSDPIVHPGVTLCKEGLFDAAYSAFSDAVARSPQSAPALYDLAVLAEARGSYDEAEGLLTKATGISPKPLYYRALERARGAREDAKSLR